MHCDRFDAQCVYPPPKKLFAQPEHVQDMKTVHDKLESLQQQINRLAEHGWLSPPRAQLQEPSKPSSIFNPSSNQSLPSPTSIDAFYARGSAQRKAAADTADTFSVARSAVFAQSTSAAPALACHPLLAISQPEALRLIDIYEDECGSAYPMIEIGDLRRFASDLYARTDVSRKPATWRAFQVDKTSKRSVNILEMVLAISLMIEGHGSSDLASALVDELASEIDHRPGVSADPFLAEILTLMSLYHFYSDEDVLAWRAIGLAARIALELGLHLHDPSFANPQGRNERVRGNQLFWCIYCLDRRWSLGTGLPFAIRDDDIDSSLPEPHDVHPYLFTSMIDYSRIGSQILRATSGSNRLRYSETEEDHAFFTYRVQQWYASLDPELRLEVDQDLNPESSSSARNRQRALQYLRRNQLRMLIHRRSLFTGASILADPQGAKTAVDLAKDTITVLDKLRNTSDVYESHQVCFNYFLYSALTLVLLAAYHAQAQFHEYCREDFSVALSLIGGVSAKSSVARKLWKIITHLKATVPEKGNVPYLDIQHGQAPGAVGQDSVHRNVDLSLDRGIVNAVDPSLNALSMSGFPTALSYSHAGLFTSGEAVDATALSVELSELFQAIDPNAFDQGPLQVERPVLLFQGTQDFSSRI